jgi:hypothetical protein
MTDAQQMKIKNYQDFYAGLMFAGFGGLTMYLATEYDLGTGANMGPGYFPYYLGALLAILGAILLIKSIGRSAGDATRVSAKPLVIFVAIMIFAIIGTVAGLTPKAGLTAGIIAGCLLSIFIGMRTMGLILGAVTLFGLLVKGLGIVLSITLLIILASLASHETKPREVMASIIFMSILSVAVFIYGLNLQMPIWPDTEELVRIFQPADKR